MLTDTNRTKIIATLGPATDNYEVLKLLIKTGVNVCRINMSHGEYTDHDKRISNVRLVNNELGTHVCILLDLQGPKIRTGLIQNDHIDVKQGDILKLTTQDVVGNADRIYINYSLLPSEVHPGNNILIDDGKITLKVVSTNGVDEIVTEIQNDGPISSRKGVNFPDSKLSVKALTDKDILDLQFAIEHDVEWVALSFVRSVHDIEHLRDLLNKHNSRAKIIAKIEKPEAVADIDSIIAASDAIMVARGDLGVEVPIQRVPVIQKNIIVKCNIASKPVIVATQMMESMIMQPTPTRAEATDVANAVMDGADAVMLSAETSVGKYPLKVIEIMGQIIAEVELTRIPYYKGERPVIASPTFVNDEVCFTAVRVSEHIKAKAIVAITGSGYTGYMVATYRPRARIYIFTRNPYLIRQLNLVWGVRGILYEQSENTDRTFEDEIAILQEFGHIVKDDMVVHLAAMPLHEAGRTNTMKITTVK